MINVRGGFMGDNHRSEKKSKTTYVVGSIVLTAAAFVVVPKVMEWGATKVFDQKIKKKSKAEDDWYWETVENAESVEKGEEKRLG